MDTFRKEYCALLITVASGECRQAQRHHLGTSYDREDSLSFLPTATYALLAVSIPEVVRCLSIAMKWNN